MVCLWHCEGWQVLTHYLEGVLREVRWPLVSRGHLA